MRSKAPRYMYNYALWLMQSYVLVIFIIVRCFTFIFLSIFDYTMHAVNTLIIFKSVHIIRVRASTD